MDYANSLIIRVLAKMADQPIADVVETMPEDPGLREGLVKAEAEIEAIVAERLAAAQASGAA
jgi:hypothetical protein